MQHNFGEYLHLSYGFESMWRLAVHQPCQDDQKSQSIGTRGASLGAVAVFSTFQGGEIYISCLQDFDVVYIQMQLQTLKKHH